MKQIGLFFLGFLFFHLSSVQAQDTKLQFNGEVRYRHQAVTSGIKAERRIQRIMARLAVKAEPNDNLDMYLRLQTGTDAASGNQTLGDSNAPGSARRGFGLDWAYGQYFFTKEKSFLLGKMKSPFVFAGNNQIILDRDISPEGGALDLKFPFEQWEMNQQFALRAGSFWVKENYDDTFGQDAVDNMLNAWQLNYQISKDDYSVNLIYGVFSYIALKSTTPTALKTATVSYDNTLDGSGNYQNDFDISQAGLEIKYKGADGDVMLFTELIKNTKADSLNAASTVGLRLSYRQWAFQYAMQKVERDAVVRLYTDSDFANGLTSAEGDLWTLSYKVDNNINIAYTQYKNKLSLHTPAQTDYLRSHIDITGSF